MNRENTKLCSRVKSLESELERTRQVIESQTTLWAELHEITTDGTKRSAN
jgi:hypothetical protein